MNDAFYKQNVDDVEIEYSVLPEIDYDCCNDESRAELIKNKAQLDLLLSQNQEKVDAINAKLETVTVNAEHLDYIIAASSGVLAGLLDVFLLGEVKPATEITDPALYAKDQISDFVVKAAKQFGCKSNNMNECVQFLSEGASNGLDVEKLTKTVLGQAQPVVAGAMDKNPALTDLITSMLTQFTGHSFTHDGKGTLYASELKNDQFVGKSFEGKIFNGISYWFLNLVLSQAKNGKLVESLGIPAPILELAKDMAELPMFKDINLKENDLVKMVSQISENVESMKETGEVKTLLKASEKVKFSSQATPVIINECVVRSFYFISRMAQKIKAENITSYEQFKSIELKDVLPVNNATITRMMTVSLGAMEAVDLAGAAVKGAGAAVKGGEAWAAMFATTFALNVNFAGIGRLVISCASEANIGAQRQQLLSDRIKLLNESLELMSSQVYYNEADMWIAAQKAGQAIDEAYNMMGHTSEKFRQMVEEVTLNINKIITYAPAVKEKNPDAVKKMKDILKWGI